MDIHMLLVFVLFLLFGHLECQKDLGVFWGSNWAWKEGQEQPLQAFCDTNNYDIIIISTLARNGKTGNTDDAPEMTLANHCNDDTLAGTPGYFSYKKCPAIEREIKHCQGKGIKILLDIGGASSHIGFSSALEARQFARQLWNLFLGGSSKIPRTFGSAKLDGINLSILKSDPSYWLEYVVEMRKLMDKSSEKKYLLTASPGCFHPNYNLNKAFQGATAAFDSFYIDFADKSCQINDEAKFLAALQIWMSYALKDNGPKLYVNTPAHPKQGYYGNRATIKKIIKKYFSLYDKQIGGVILKDASWDQRNIANGKSYGGFIRAILDGENPKLPTTPPVTLTPATTKATTSKPKTLIRDHKGRIIIIVDVDGNRALTFSSALSLGPSTVLISFILMASLVFIRIFN